MMDINFFNPRSVILFICILQGVIFALLLFWRSSQKKTLADFWLGVLLIVMCSSLLTHFVGFAGVYDANQNLTFFPFEIVFAHAPVIYLYVQSLTNARRGFGKRDLLLFVPTFVYLSYRFVLFWQDLAFKDWYNANLQNIYIAPPQSILLFVWNLAFLYFSIKHYRRYRSWLNDNFSDTELVKFNWLRNFLYLFVFVFLCNAAFEFTDAFLFNLSFYQFYYLNLIIAFLTYYLAIAGFLRSQTIEVNFAEQIELSQPKAAEDNEIEVQPRKTPVAESELEKLKANLQILMIGEKPYLEPQLTLADLSKQLGLNQNVLSHVINQGFGKNFNDFINEYRVAEVKEKLNSQSAKNLSLLGVAFECGFNSKATFNRAFKKIAGVSPKDFQDQAE